MRENLYLSYVGQSIRQSLEIPPSVVVNELLDGLDKLADFGTEGENDVRQETNSLGFRLCILLEMKTMRETNFTGRIREIILTHPWPFRCPDDETLPFVSEKMAEPEDELTELTMEKLIRFFISPAEAFFEGKDGDELT